MPAGFKLVTFFNFLAIVALLLLGIWSGGYVSLLLASDEGHEIKLVPIESSPDKAPEMATGPAASQTDSPPGRHLTPDPATLRWRFAADGSLLWSDPAQQQKTPQ